MGTAPAEALSSAKEINPQNSSGSTEPGAVAGIDPADLIDSLRQAVSCKTETVDSVLKAIAAAAQVLTGANGIAVALRHNGRIVCRARSGDIAPELGATIDPDSGLSGECVRAAAILMCHDTFTDKRVEAEVCREMGIRSIVAVPLRGEMGMAGVLEAFSSRPNAFDSSALNLLRTLSQIAEAAYARERGEALRAVPLSAKTPARTMQIVVDDVLGRAYATKSSGRVWIIATVAMALLTFSVAWWSWHHTAEEVENVIQAGHAGEVETVAPAVNSGMAAAAPKPTPATPALQSAGARQNGVRARKILLKSGQAQAAKNPSEMIQSPLAQNAENDVAGADGVKGTD